MLQRSNNKGAAGSARARAMESTVSDSMIESALNTSQHAINRTVSDLKDGVASTSATYARMSDDAARVTTAWSGLGQGWTNAFAESCQMLMAGTQDLVRQMVQANQTVMTEATANMRALASVRSLKDGLQLQANIARTGAVWSVNEAARLAHAGIELAEKASAPVAAQLYASAEKMGSFKG